MPGMYRNEYTTQYCTSTYVLETGMLAYWLRLNLLGNGAVHTKFKYYLRAPSAVRSIKLKKNRSGLIMLYNMVVVQIESKYVAPSKSIGKFPVLYVGTFFSYFFRH